MVTRKTGQGRGRVEGRVEVVWDGTQELRVWVGKRVVAFVQVAVDEGTVTGEDEVVLKLAVDNDGDGQRGGDLLGMGMALVRREGARERGQTGDAGGRGAGAHRAGRGRLGEGGGRGGRGRWAGLGWGEHGEKKREDKTDLVEGGGGRSGGV